MKRLIRRWLGLRDTHHMTCKEMQVFGELLEVSDPCCIREGSQIEVGGMRLRVEAHVLRVTKL